MLAVVYLVAASAGAFALWFICVERVEAARATASSPSGWNARMPPTADRYIGLGQRVPNIEREVSR